LLTEDLYVIGIGPGDLDSMSRQAYQTLKAVDIIVGYTTYIKCVEEIISKEQETYVSGMRKEKERVKKAIEYAQSGKKVALISSGDPGVYGMAGLALEISKAEAAEIKIKVLPGITAANAAAAVLGAPLMHDYAVISLSDLLTPWEVIEDRLIKAAKSDFVIALYNPKSKQRKEQIKWAQEIFLQYRDADTPVGIVRSAKRGTEELESTTLEQMLDFEINMLTTVIIGNSETYSSEDLIITPRGYQL